MRHFFLLLIALPLVYVLWHLAKRPAQRQAVRWVLRLAALSVGLIALLVLTYQTTAIKLL
jgi:hypothetical protein